MAARIAVSCLHKSTCTTFHETVKKLYHYEDKGINSSLLSDDLYNIVMENKVNIHYILRKKLKMKLFMKEIILMTFSDSKLLKNHIF